MKVPHPARRWAILWMFVAVFLPLSALGRTRHATLPDGACGTPQEMLEATQTGNQMVQQSLATAMPWGDKTLNEYINRLGQNLARSSGSQQAFSFYVVYNPEVNAQAFPGGYVVINSGAISLAENEAELASVLSHEIAHENACHWRTKPHKGDWVELIALVPTMVFAGPAGIAIAAGGGWASTLARAHSDRDEEERADRWAAQYLTRAGYDPHAAVRFFQRLQAEEQRTGKESGGLMATHPRALNRQKNLEKFIPTLPPVVFLPHDESEFLRMRRAVRNYDEIYASVIGVHVPGLDPPPPVLSRRPSTELNSRGRVTAVTKR